MKKPRQALNMVVPAPINDCRRALYELETAPFIDGHIFVNTRHVDRNAFQFEITLSRREEKSPADKVLRGTLNYSRETNTTIVTGDVLPIQRHTFWNIAALEMLFLLIAGAVVIISQQPVEYLLLAVMSSLLLVFGMISAWDRYDTYRVVSITKRALRQLDPKKGHRYAKRQSEESPFYDEDEYPDEQNGDLPM